MLTPDQEQARKYLMGLEFDPRKGMTLETFAKEFKGNRSLFEQTSPEMEAQRQNNLHDGWLEFVANADRNVRNRTRRSTMDSPSYKDPWSIISKVCANAFAIKGGKPVPYENPEDVPVMTYRESVTSKAIFKAAKMPLQMLQAEYDVIDRFEIAPETIELLRNAMKMTLSDAEMKSFDLQGSESQN